jgi:hypothetical protein
MKQVGCLGALLLVAACGSSSSSGAAAPPPPPPASVANGTIDGWQTQGALPTPRGNHCSVAVNGWLVVIGGNYEPKGATMFEDLDDVIVAKASDDGTLGPWTLAGHTPSKVNSCTVTAWKNDIYLVDGIFESDAPDATTFAMRKATLADDGTLGAWSQIGTLSDSERVLYSSATVSKDGVLAAFHAKLPMAGDAISLAVGAIGAGGAMQIADVDWLKGFRGHPQYAFADSGFAYALGGYGGDAANTFLASGSGVALGADMRPSGAAFDATALPKATAFGQAIAVDDWVFVIGGKDAVFGANGRADVFAAHIDATGALGAWTTLASLPQGRTSHSVAVSGDWLYVTGGGYDKGGLDTVFSARVRFAP